MKTIPPGHEAVMAAIEAASQSPKLQNAKSCTAYATAKSAAPAPLPKRTFCGTKVTNTISPAKTPFLPSR